MVTESPKAVEASPSASPPAEARSVKFARQGITTGEDFANTMSALMSDLIEGAVSPEVGNAVCNAGGKLLKMVELRFKYGSPPKSPDRPDLVLAQPAPPNGVESKGDGDQD